MRPQVNVLSAFLAATPQALRFTSAWHRPLTSTSHSSLSLRRKLGFQKYMSIQSIKRNSVFSSLTPKTMSSESFCAYATDGAEPSAESVSVSESLRKKKCAPCSRKAVEDPVIRQQLTMPDEDINTMLSEYPLWTMRTDRKALVREFVATNWEQALAFINQVSEIAESENHHPDIHLTNYRNVKLELGTHSLNAVTKNDFILAAKIDHIEVSYSDKWMKGLDPKQRDILQKKKL